MPGLPAEVQYFIDSSFETGDIPGDVHAFLDVFDEGTLEWFDGLDRLEGPIFPVFRAEARARLAAWRAHAPAAERAAVTWSGIGGLGWALPDSAKHLVGAGVRRLMADAGSVDHRRLAATFADDDFVAAHAFPFIPGLAEVSSRAADDLRVFGAAPFRDARRVVEAAADGRRQLAVSDVSKLRTLSERPPPRRERKARRKPMVRAVGLLERFAGRTACRAWLSGDGMVVEGRRFDFRLRLRVLSSSGHGANDICVLDKDGVPLVDLCFYFRDTPAPDQVAALILHVKAGNEDEIIRTGNFIRTHPGGVGHGELAAIRAERSVAKTATADRDPMLAHIDAMLFDGVRGSARAYNDSVEVAEPLAVAAILRVASSLPGTRVLEECQPGIERSWRVRRVAPWHDPADAGETLAVEAA